MYLAVIQRGIPFALALVDGGRRREIFFFSFPPCGVACSRSRWPVMGDGRSYRKGWSEVLQVRLIGKGAYFMKEVTFSDALGRLTPHAPCCCATGILLLRSYREDTDLPPCDNKKCAWTWQFVLGTCDAPTRCLLVKILSITPHCDVHNSIREVRGWPTTRAKDHEAVEEQPPHLGKRQDPDEDEGDHQVLFSQSVLDVCCMPIVVIYVLSSLTRGSKSLGSSTDANVAGAPHTHLEQYSILCKPMQASVMESLFVHHVFPSSNCPLHEHDTTLSEKVSKPLSTASRCHSKSHS